MSKKKIGTWNGVPVYTDFLPFGTRRTGQKLTTGKPRFAVFHDTGNPDTTAQDNVNYYRNTYNIDWAMVASAHVFVDDKEAIICIPVTEKAWHVLYDTPTDNAWYGVDANDGAFGIEACYFKNKERSMKSLDNACRIAAVFCESWTINPKNEMPGHQDIQADKQDPGNILAACGYGRRDMKVIDNLVVGYMKGKSKSLKKQPKTIFNWTGKFTTHKTNKEPIVVRKQPGLKGTMVDKNSWIYPNQYVKFDRIYKKDGFWWLGFYYQQKGASKNRFYMSIGKIEDKKEKILNEKHLWGKLEVEKHGK